MEIISGKPEPKRSRYWPIYALEVDQSVVFSPGEYKLTTLRTSITYAQHRYGKRFTIRLQPDGGIRVWRTA